MMGWTSRQRRASLANVIRCFGLLQAAAPRARRVVFALGERIDADLVVAGIGIDAEPALVGRA
jgi:hypothetical protein